MRRLILISAIAVAALVAACSPGTDDGTETGTFPVESQPVVSLPSDMPSVEPSATP